MIEYCIPSLNGWLDRKVEPTLEILSMKLLQLRTRRLGHQVVFNRICLQHFIVFIDGNYPSFGPLRIWPQGICRFACPYEKQVELLQQKIVRSNYKTAKRISSTYFVITKLYIRSGIIGKGRQYHSRSTIGSWFLLRIYIRSALYKNSLKSF